MRREDYVQEGGRQGKGKIWEKEKDKKGEETR